MFICNSEIAFEDYMGANFRHIVKNWRKEVIRKKHNYSLRDYIVFWELYLSELFKVGIENAEIKDFSKKLYGAL